MSRTFSVMFRGERRDVIVTRYARAEPDVNAGAEIEWLFDDVAPEDHEALGVTDVEEDQILAQLAKKIEENAYGD